MGDGTSERNRGVLMCLLLEGEFGEFLTLVEDRTAHSNREGLMISCRKISWCHMGFWVVLLKISVGWTGTDESKMRAAFSFSLRTTSWPIDEHGIWKVLEYWLVLGALNALNIVARCSQPRVQETSEGGREQGNSCSQQVFLGFLHFGL